MNDGFPPELQAEQGSQGTVLQRQLQQWWAELSLGSPGASAVFLALDSAFISQALASVRGITQQCRAPAGVFLSLPGGAGGGEGE